MRGRGLYPDRHLRHRHSFARASRIAQLVKKLPAVHETRVRFPSREDPLEASLLQNSQQQQPKHG